MKFKRTLNEETLFTGDEMTVDALISVLQEVKRTSGGRTRVVFEEPVNFDVCDVHGATLKMAVGSGTGITTFDDDEDYPRNAKPVICLYNYD